MSPEETAQNCTSTDTGYIAGDDGWTRWRNTFALLLGRMNDEGKAQYRTARDDRWEADDCERCDKYKEHLLAYSKPCSPPTGSAFWQETATHMTSGPIIRFMREKINVYGGDVNSVNIRCRRCYRMQSGGFDPDYGIQICANTLKNRNHMEDTLAHGPYAPIHRFVAGTYNCPNRDGSCIRPPPIQGQLGEQSATCCLYGNQSICSKRRM